MPDRRSSVPPAPGRTTTPSSVVRATACVVLFVLAFAAIATGLVAGWARAQLVDEDAFVATLAPLSADPAVQDAVITETTAAITASVDFSALARAGTDGASALGLPPAVSRALGLLAAPTAGALRSVTEAAVADVVRSPSFSEVWSGLVRGAHRGVVFGATSDGGGIIVQTPEGLGVQLGGVVSAVVDVLIAQDSPVSGLIPSVDRVVVISDGTTLQALRAGYTATTVAGVVAPIAAVVLLCGGVLAAARRSRAVIGAGTAVGGGAGVVLVGCSWAPAAAQRSEAARDLDGAAVDAVVRQLLSGLPGAAGVVLVVGIVVTTLGIVLSVRTRGRAAPGAFVDDAGAGTKP